MKYLLIGINSKYSHTNLAIRTLRAYAKSPEVDLCEYTINEPRGFVMSEIFKRGADALFFSCYIWNIEYIKALCSDIRKVTDAKIILGGPEVSFNPEMVMSECSAVDACIIGEGEETFSELVKGGLDFENTDGIVYRGIDGIIKNKPRELILDISTIDFPYTQEELKALDGKLIYYESARGCPFNCSYCMSSTVKGVRYRDTELVKRELKFFIDNNVKTVKLTDRTFNANPDRTLEILKFLIETGGNTTFHFEIAAHILNDEIFDVLKHAPKDLFQFEIGVQSTNLETVFAINRRTDFDRICREVRRIKELGTIHLHLDLIAGLPYEDIESFKKSFNDVFALRPDMLQLGFLKLLHGTHIREEKDKHGYIFSGLPPYEVLGNKYISYSELIKLKCIEEIVDKFYNSGAFKRSIEYLITKFDTAFSLFSEISECFTKKDLFSMSHSRNGLFEILVDFAKEKGIDKVFLDILKLDYLSMGVTKSPLWSLKKSDEAFYKRRFDIIENNPDIFSKFSALPMREIIKQVHFEEFSYDVLGDFEERENILVFFKDGTVRKI